MTNPPRRNAAWAERKSPAAREDRRSGVSAAIQAVRRGNRDAFAEVVEVYQRRLFGLALMVTRDPAGAEEVVQDAFTRAFVNLDSYDGRRPFYPWLATIAVRLAQNWVAKRTRTTAREGTELGENVDATADGADPLEGLIAQEEERRVWRSVAALPAGERTGVILFYHQGMSIAEVATILGVTSGTIKTLLFRARQRLRRLLGDSRAGEASI